MAQVTTGVRSVLSNPKVYERFQRLVGSPRVRRELLDQHVRPRHGMRILDIGCGPGDLVTYFEDDVTYTGTDLSPAYIALAQERFGDRARYFVGDVADLDPASMGEFDIAIAMGVLHHIDEAQALHLFASAAAMLAPGGRLVTLDAAYTPDMSRAARWVVSRDRGQSILAPEGYERLARTAFGTVRSAVHHNLLRIPYTHVFLECTDPLPSPSGTDSD